MTKPSDGPTVPAAIYPAVPKLSLKDHARLRILRMASVRKQSSDDAPAQMDSQLLLPPPESSRPGSLKMLDTAESARVLATERLRLQAKSARSRNMILELSVDGDHILWVNYPWTIVNRYVLSLHFHSLSHFANSSQLRIRSPSSPPTALLALFSLSSRMPSATPVWRTAFKSIRLLSRSARVPQPPSLSRLRCLVLLRPRRSRRRHDHTLKSFGVLPEKWTKSCVRRLYCAWRLGGPIWKMRCLGQGPFLHILCNMVVQHCLNMKRGQF